MGSLSDKLGGLTFTPKAQSPFKAGAIINVAGDDVSSWEAKNWFQCDGSEYAEADYPDLFAQLGSKYNTGGETASHFRVPDGPYRTIDTIVTDLTSTPSGWSLIAESNTVWCNALGEWWCTLHFSANTSVLTADGQIITIAGLTFASGAQIGAADEGSPGQVPFTVSAGGSSLTLNADSGQQTNGWNSSGTFKLASKPTDAFVGADSRFSTFDEALESVPMIKVYNDESNIAMSIADATDTKTGAVRLSSDFAAGDGVYGFVQGNTVETFVITTNQTSDGVIHTFTGLVVGKVYRISGTFNCLTSSTDTAVRVLLKHDGSTLDAGRVQNDTSIGDLNNSMRLGKTFKATTTTATVETSSASANAYVVADGANERSFAELETLENYIIP